MDEGAGSVGGAAGYREKGKSFVEFGRAMVPGRGGIERTFLDPLPAAPDEPSRATALDGRAGFEGVDFFWTRAGHTLLGGYEPSG